MNHGFSVRTVSPGMLTGCLCPYFIWLLSRVSVPPVCCCVFQGSQSSSVAQGKEKRNRMGKEEDEEKGRRGEEWKGTG